MNQLNKPSPSLPTAGDFLSIAAGVLLVILSGVL